MSLQLMWWCHDTQLLPPGTAAIYNPVMGEIDGDFLDMLSEYS